MTNSPPLDVRLTLSTLLRVQQLMGQIDGISTEFGGGRSFILPEMRIWPLQARERRPALVRLATNAIAVRRFRQYLVKAPPFVFKALQQLDVAEDFFYTRLDMTRFASTSIRSLLSASVVEQSNSSSAAAFFSSALNDYITLILLSSASNRSSAIPSLSSLRSPYRLWRTIETCLDLVKKWPSGGLV